MSTEDEAFFKKADDGRSRRVVRSSVSSGEPIEEWRYCKKCGSRLSSYNRSDICFAHQSGVSSGSLSYSGPAPGVSSFYGDY